MVKIDIVERLRFDAVRCEATFSKGVAGNIEEAADEIERLRAAQWPEEATDAMKRAVYALNLRDNHLCEDDVIDIFDAMKGTLSLCQQQGGEK